MSAKRIGISRCDGIDSAMFKTNDFIIYGKMGVCKIINITVPDKVSTKQLYYVLEQTEDNCIIYAPVDTKVPMRPIISADEANRLIDMIPDIKAKAYYNEKMMALTQHYKEAIEAFNCEDLIELIKSIYAKKQIAQQQNRKLGQIDGKFMKQAEELLYNEFSYALGIPKDTVPDYIAARVEKAGLPQDDDDNA